MFKLCDFITYMVYSINNTTAYVPHSINLLDPGVKIQLLILHKCCVLGEWLVGLDYINIHVQYPDSLPPLYNTVMHNFPSSIFVIFMLYKEQTQYFLSR